MSTIRRVIVESPYAGDIEQNVQYARIAMRDCLERGEAPYASHLLYTQVLDDTVPAEREQGIAAGLAWQPVADAVVVYTDLGITSGMQRAIDQACVPVEYRTLKPVERNAYDYYEPDEIGKTAVCQCGVRKPLKELSRGCAGFTERNKPCYHCNECIPF